MSKDKNTDHQIIGYLRVSTLDQNTEKFKADILSFANSRGMLGKVEFVSEQVSGMKSWKHRKLKGVVDAMERGDTLIVPELSRLGRSLVEVLEVLNELSKRDVAVYSVKEGFKLNSNDMQSKIMRTMLALFSEIERDLISARTREGLEAARASGKKLGRPLGSGKSKLDPFKAEITNLLNVGVPKSVVARKYGLTPIALYNWLKKHGLRTRDIDYCGHSKVGKLLKRGGTPK